MKMLKMGVVVIITAVVFFVAGWSLNTMMTVYNWRPTNPFKVVNPHDPRFDPEDFRINDYKTSKELREAFSVVFKPGMSKNDVDQIMLKSLCPPSPPSKNEYDPGIRYSCSSKFHLAWLWAPNPTPKYSHLFLFDDNQRLINIHPRVGGDKIFQDMPGKNEIKQQLLDAKEKENGNP